MIIVYSANNGGSSKVASKSAAIPRSKDGRKAKGLFNAGVIGNSMIVYGLDPFLC